MRSSVKARLRRARCEGGVDAGHDALAGGLLVAAGAVDLAGEEEAGDGLDLEGAVELGGVDGVVLDGVAGAEHLGVLEAGDAVDHGGWTSMGSEVDMPLM